MREIKLPRNDIAMFAEEDKYTGVVDWKADQETCFEAVDSVLQNRGFELVMVDTGDDTFMFYIDELPSKEKKIAPRVFKRAPEKNYETNYKMSIALINMIADETRQPYQSAHPDVLPYSPDVVLEMLVSGQTVVVFNPFGTRIEYSLENVT